MGGVFALWWKQSLTDFATTRRLLVAHPTVAVPDKIIGLTLFLDFIDRCHSLASFLPPQAAVGSLPPRDNLLLIKNYKTQKPLRFLGFLFDIKSILVQIWCKLFKTPYDSKRS